MTRNLIFIMLAGLLLTGLGGCGSSNSDAPTINASGQHPSAWPSLHGAAYLARAEQCYECHGRDLKGGISKVSCFSDSWQGRGCHASGPGGHPAGWDTPSVHGPHAKARVGGADGFSYCQRCHGTLLNGGSAKKSCYSCHGVSAPHAPRPWRGGTYSHTTTDPTNAAVCALCHTAGANLTPGLQQGTYATGTPGCFNNTLCHGQVGHPTNWGLPASHGPAAKAKPSATVGFTSCQNCHGNDYAGGLSQKSCFSCHGVSAPHSPKPWRGGYYTHTTTDTGNADACADCHTAGANLTPGLRQLNYVSGTPGCFNNTLCHGAAGHPTGWQNPDQHGGTAKAAPGTTSGFDYCRNCHGLSFNGGAGQTCLGSCHGSGVMAPHPQKPWAGTARTHATTDPGNASMCNLCHNNGANSTLKPSTPAPAGTSAGCFNSTLCHATMGHPSGWNDPTVHGTSAKAAVSSSNGFPRCQECHGTQFDGGIVNKTCFTCHGVPAPHAPKPWRAGTYTHTTTDQSNVAVCALCHTAGANLTPSFKLASYVSGTPGCYNSTLCHGAVGHPAGWAAASQHGTAAKAAPGTTTGFSYCVTCHVDYRNGTGSSCFQCHTTAPHPPAPWRGTTATRTSHTATSQGNAPQCARCHLNNARLTTPVSVPAGTTPGCFNNTLCHGVVGHPAGWAQPLQHGTQYGANPLSCQPCHGADLKGGTSGVSCIAGQTGCHVSPVHNPPLDWELNHGRSAKLAPGGTFDSFFTCRNCHGTSFSGTPVSAATGCLSITCHKMVGYAAIPPHSGAWNDPYNMTLSTHTATDPANAPVCFQCHNRVQGPHIWLNSTAQQVTIANMLTPVTGNSDPAATPGCFNNTLCHGQISGHAFPYPGASHKRAAGPSPFTVCTGCHSIGTSASPYPVATGVKPDCMACHTKAQPVGNPARCDSCHGTSANGGLPVGKLFPDRAGRHDDHAGFSCGTCHAGAGTGVASHGNSNRLKKNPTDVYVSLPGGITFTSNGSTTTGGGKCNGTCHDKTHTNRSW